MKVAIAHDYLTQRGGAERVVLAIARAFPGAPIYTTLYEPELTYPEFNDLDIRPSSLNRIRALRRNHRAALPFLARASHSVSIDADIVIASSSGWAHGFQTTGKTLVYCHSPARWLYQTETYLGRGILGPSTLAIRMLRPYLRSWDRKAAARADYYLANSSVVRDRIQACYGRDAEVLPAPIVLRYDAGPPTSDGPEAGYFLCVSRLLPYKNVRKIITAFRTRTERLVIVGSGPLLEEIVANAPPNVTVFSDVTDSHLAGLYRDSQGVIAASYEDFGLTPIEGAMFGKPTVALRWGGFLDTVREGETGTYFDTPTPAAISEALDHHARTDWDPSVIKKWADTFSEARFARRLRDHVDRAMTETSDRDSSSRFSAA